MHHFADMDQENEPLDKMDKYKDIDTENKPLDKMDKYQNVDPEKELFNDIEEDKGPCNVKKEAFGTEKRDKDVDKDEDKNLGSENSRLEKELSDVEKRSEIEDVTVENMVTVEYKAIKSEKLRDENPKEDDDKPEKQHESKKVKEDRLAFNAFYHYLATKIMDDERIMTTFRVLLDLEPNEHTLNANEMNLFHQWNNEHKFFFNIWHLQELLKKSKAEDLVQECEKFAEKRLPSMKLCYFSRKIKDFLILRLEL